MIPNGEGWHYLAVNKLPALLRGITSKHHGDFYCLNCLHSFVTENKRESHEKLCENKGFCNVAMHSGETKILAFNQYQKSDKASFIIYAELECLIKKIDGCKSNPEDSSTTKVGQHILLGFSMSAIPSFKIIENKHDINRSKDFIKKFCEYSREQVMEIISFK